MSCNPKKPKLSEESLVNAHQKSNLSFKGSKRKGQGGGGKTRSKNKSYSTMFSFPAHIGNPHLQVKIPVSFCNCLQTKVLLSANRSLKKKK